MLKDLAELNLISDSFRIASDRLAQRQLIESELTSLGPNPDYSPFYDTDDVEECGHC